MAKSLRRAWLLAAAVAGLAIGPAYAQDQKLTTVHLVSSTVNPPSVSNMYYLAAITGGFFANHGLDVQLQQSAGSPSSVAAIVSGKAEFASINLNTLSNAITEGVKARIVVTGNFDSPKLLLSQKEIGSLKDLEGKTMGTSAIGSTEYTVAVSYLTQKGVDVSKITWVATRQTSNTIQSMIANRVDAAVLVLSSGLDALARDPSLKVLGDAEDIAAIAPNTGGIVVVTDQFAQDHPDVVQNFVAAIVESNRKLFTDHDFYEQIITKWFPDIYTQDQRDLMYKSYRPSWGVNGGLNMPVMDEMVDNWKTTVNPDGAKKGLVKSADDLVNNSFAKVELDKIGVMPDVLDKATWYKK